MKRAYAGIELLPCLSHPFEWHHGAWAILMNTQFAWIRLLTHPLEWVFWECACLSFQHAGRRLLIQTACLLVNTYVMQWKNSIWVSINYAEVDHYCVPLVTVSLRQERSSVQKWQRWLTEKDIDHYLCKIIISVSWLCLLSRLLIS